MNINIRNYLEDLEARLNVDEEQRLLGLWKGFVEHRSQDPIFTPLRNPTKPGNLGWPEVNVNDAIQDSTFNIMLLEQLGLVNELISSTNGNLPMIRANYGSNILATLLGCQLHMMDRELNTLPGAMPLAGGIPSIKKMMDKGMPRLDGGQCHNVFECVAHFRNMLADYPKLQQMVRIYHPDFQGVLDIAEVLMGSEIFLAFYDDPAFIRELLAFISEVYIAVVDKYFSLFPPANDDNFHYGWMHKGKIRISLDSCVNFSPDDYREFILPFDKKLINRYGGIIHSCGKIDHFIGILPEIGEGYYGFNLSQYKLNNMETVYASTIDRDILIYNLDPDAAALSAGRRNMRLVHAPMPAKTNGIKHG